MAETTAKLKGARMSAQKCRPVADIVRGLSVTKAVQLLSLSKNKAAFLIKGVIESAQANAENNFAMETETLKISSIYVDEGSVMKRFRARAKGRGNRILKKTCHITVNVSD